MKQIHPPPCTIDLKREVRLPSVSPYGPDTTENPQGGTFTADTLSLAMFPPLSEVKIAVAKAASALDKIIVTADEQIEVEVSY